MFKQILKNLINKLYNIINTNVEFKVKLFNDDVIAPFKADSGCAGYDVFSTKNVIIPDGERCLIPLGFAVQVPNYYYLRVAPRSGLSLRGIDIGAGVIDSSYRGEVMVLVINNTGDDYEVKEGDKIAQLIMERCANVEIQICYEYSDSDSEYDDDLTETSRGTNGFGSTGDSIKTD